MSRTEGVIAAKVVKRSRRSHACEAYTGTPHVGYLPPGSEYVRLYGSAHGETPWTLALCRACAEATSDPKVVAALHAARAAVPRPGAGEEK